MEIVCEQLAKDNSITGTSTGTSSAELRFLVCGTNDIEEGLAAVRSKAPKSYAGCPLSGITFDKQDSLYAIYYRVSYASSGVSGTVSGAENVSYTFSTTGMNVRLLKPIRRFDAKAFVDDPEYADLSKFSGIGWDPQSEQYEGVEIQSGVMQESYTRQISFREFTTSYKRLIGSMLYTVNSKPFKGWKPGEALFADANLAGNISGADEDVLPITFSFLISPQLDDFKINDNPNVTVSKRGWTYLWYIYDKKPDEASGHPVPKMLAAFLDQTYRETDFGALKI